MTWADEEIKGKVLHKLTRMGKFHHSHTAVEHLQKGFPGDVQGKVKAMVAELIREGILFTKPTNYGLQVSVNAEYRERIMRYIEAFLNRD